MKKIFFGGSLKELNDFSETHYAPEEIVGNRFEIIGTFYQTGETKPIDDGQLASQIDKDLERLSADGLIRAILHRSSGSGVYYGYYTGVPIRKRRE